MPNTSSARRTLLLGLSSAALMAGCGGIPLRSLPRLARLSKQLLDADPAEFGIAVQLDVRMAPPPQAHPWLLLKLTPRKAGSFDPVDARLPLRAGPPSGGLQGLDPAPRGRRWLVYSLPPETQAELRRVQAQIRQARPSPGEDRGGSLSIGIEQNDLATAMADPALVNTSWQTWVQTHRSEGFFMLWEGTPAQLLAQARTAPPTPR